MSRTNASPQKFPTLPPPPPRPQRTGLFLWLIVIGLLVLGAAGIGVAFTLGAFDSSETAETGDSRSGESDSPPTPTLAHKGLQLVSVTGDEFAVSIFDTEAFATAIGNDLPGSGEEIFRWLVDNYAEQGTAVYDADALVRFTPETLGLVFDTGGYLDYSAGDDEPLGHALLGAPTEDELTEALGEPLGAADEQYWQDEEISGHLFFRQIDGRTLFATDERHIANEIPSPEDSLATDASVVSVLEALQATGGYEFTIERGPAPAEAITELTGEAPDEIVTYGSALNYRDGVGYATLAYDFGSAADAQANLELVEESFAEFSRRLDHSEPLDISTEGSLILVEFTLEEQVIVNEAQRLLHILAY